MLRREWAARFRLDHSGTENARAVIMCLEIKDLAGSGLIMQEPASRNTG